MFVDPFQQNSAQRQYLLQLKMKHWSSNSNQVAPGVNVQHDQMKDTHMTSSRDVTCALGQDLEALYIDLIGRISHAKGD